MTAYDIIGDVHGSADKLEGLLRVLGYEEVDGAYRLDGHQAVFVGDLIDRGDDQVRVVDLVRAMDEAGSARVVMGNHEFNAISWVTPHPDRPGDYMRTHRGPRGAHNRRHHARFLAQVGEGSPRHLSTVAWFRTLPLSLDLGGLRIAHACWHPASLAVLDKWVVARGAGHRRVHRRGQHPVLGGLRCRRGGAEGSRGPSARRPGLPRPRGRAAVGGAGPVVGRARRRRCGSWPSSPVDPGRSTAARTPGLPDRASDHADDFRYTDPVPGVLRPLLVPGGPASRRPGTPCASTTAPYDPRGPWWPTAGRAKPSPPPTGSWPSPGPVGDRTTTGASPPHRVVRGGQQRRRPGDQGHPLAVVEHGEQLGHGHVGGLLGRHPGGQDPGRLGHPVVVAEPVQGVVVVPPVELAGHGGAEPAGHDGVEVDPAAQLAEDDGRR